MAPNVPDRHDIGRELKARSYTTPRDSGLPLEALQALGVSNVVAISGDNHERAATAVREWDIGALPVAYDLSLAQMRKWGLYVSRGVQAPEPEQFNEPGLYLIRPDTSIYSAHLQSTPFARPARLTCCMPSPSSTTATTPHAASCEPPLVATPEGVGLDAGETLPAPSLRRTSSGTLRRPGPGDGPTWPPVAGRAPRRRGFTGRRGTNPPPAVRRAAQATAAHPGVGPA